MNNAMWTVKSLINNGLFASPETLRACIRALNWYGENGGFFHPDDATIGLEIEGDVIVSRSMLLGEFDLEGGWFCPQYGFVRSDAYYENYAHPPIAERHEAVEYARYNWMSDGNNV